MASRIDDPCVGQREQDQTQMRIVVRHLVDEVRGAALAVDTRAFKVLIAQGAPLLRAERGQHARVGFAIGRFGTSRKPARHRDDVGELHRPFDLRMAGQDLLDERRPGARQTDDEYRRGRRIASTRAGVDEFRGE